MRWWSEDAKHSTSLTAHTWTSMFVFRASATAIVCILWELLLLLLLGPLFQTQSLVIPLEVFAVLWKKKNKLNISTYGIIEDDACTGTGNTCWNSRRKNNSAEAGRKQCMCTMYLSIIADLWMVDRISSLLLCEGVIWIFLGENSTIVLESVPWEQCELELQERKVMGAKRSKNWKWICFTILVCKRSWGKSRVGAVCREGGREREWWEGIWQLSAVLNQSVNGWYWIPFRTQA